MNEVQTLIDSLAARLRSPAGVDDRRFRAVAYSSHADEIDAVRRTSILGRQAPEAVTDWLEELGVRSARGYLRVPANPALEMVARVCFPVRFHDRLLGFLWLVEADGPLGDEQLALCLRCAEELAEELYRLQQQGDGERREEAAEVARLLSPRRHGAADSAPRIAAAALYAALVVQIALPGEQAAPAAIDVRLTEAVDRLRRAVPPRHQLADVGETRATIVVAATTEAELEAHATSLLAAVQEELSDVPDAEVVVGVGDPATAPAGLPESAAHARLAVQMARSMAGLGPLVTWSELGVLRLLVELVGDRDPSALLPASLRRLLADPDGEQLAATLETYLDHGGDATGAAAALFLHRSSLYNRLHRIEELAGIDSKSGADRLELHLGLRLWRMGGGGS